MFLEELCCDTEKLMKDKEKEEKRKAKGKAKIEEEAKLENKELVPCIDWASLDVFEFLGKLQVKDVMVVIEQIEEIEVTMIISKVDMKKRIVN